MSTIDLWTRDLVTKYGLLLALLLVLSGLLSWKWSRYRQSHYKAFLLGFESECAELAAAHKKRLFGQLAGIVSRDELLRSLRRIRILEIGVKTGENIRYYPEGAHFIGVDWNRRLGEYLMNGDRSWQFAHLVFERLVIGDGSSLKGIPTGCVDVVVSTRSLCSTKSVGEALREIRRVLVPGGKYLFFEHLPDEEGSFINWIQVILSKTKLWPSLFGGCRLDSNPIECIENSGFEQVKWEHVVLHGYVSQPHHLLLSRNHIIGSATR